MNDIVIIGCGVIGANIAYELSKLNLNITILEKQNDVSLGTSRANSSIVHAGYDPEPNTLIAKLNVEGSHMMEDLCKKLDVLYKKTGSFVLAFDDTQRKEVEKLYERGLKNGVSDLSIIEKDEILMLEPNINSDVLCALSADSAAVVSPWGLTIALSEVAIANGANLKLNTEVLDITKENDMFVVKTNNGDLKTKYVINCAGVNALNVYEMFFDKKYKSLETKGEYFLLDKKQGELVEHVIFRCPDENGKGVLVAKTVHGNLIVGPNSEKACGSDDVSTTTSGQNKVLQTSLKSVPDINFRENIRNFAGVRAIIDANDFIIERHETENNFINLLGIKSPGLSASPAIAKMVAKMFTDDGYKNKRLFTETRHQVYFKHLDINEKNKLIKENPKYGKIICRCESITEGEIIDAINIPIECKTIDAIKRRAGTGMGRCQGGFCAPKILEIIAREKNIPVTDILMDKEGSYIITSETKNGGK